MSTGELALLLLADARLPSGGHTQSAGLEPALAAGLSIADVPGYLRARLATVTRTDAGTAVVTRHLLREGVSGQPGTSLQTVLDAWSARCPSQHVRAASCTLGRGLLRVLRSQWPEHPVTLALPPRDVPRPVALGGLAAVLDLGPAELARLACYDDLQSATAAALKLEPLDPLDTVRWILDCADPIARVVAETAPLRHPDQIPAAAAPALEEWVHGHAGRSGRRLFTA